MPLIQLKDVSASFGGPPLLDRVSLSIGVRERIGLIGRNGSGKTTLLKIIDGSLDVDDGEITRNPQLGVSRLVQEVPSEIGGDVRTIIATGDPLSGKSLADWYRGTDVHPDARAWELDSEVKRLLSVFSLDGEEEFNTLSGGMKRRTLLARALVCEPQLLLLDEPTNHLDIETIEWMESLLKGLSTTLVIISHDRSFINNLATRIIELDRGRLTSWPGNFDTYVAGKMKLLAEEERHNAAFDKKLEEEERWIRQGIKARRTRNEGRVRALEKMRKERRERREKENPATFGLNEASGSGRIVIEAFGLGFSYETNPVIRSLDTTILRGDRIGIIGPNGCGKSTLIRLLTGDLDPTQGSVNHGTRLQTAYLDQHRSQIRDDLNVLDNVSAGHSEITINGKSRHVVTYLREFLFSPERMRTPAGSLSGGERNRLMLARLFTTPFNLLILDEPTNDLDIETLELLEELLLGYSGTLLLVSHDRSFLNNIVTSTLVFGSGGEVREFVGGYDDWLRQSGGMLATDTPGSSRVAPRKTIASKTEGRLPSVKKLSYMEKRELDSLPGEIEALEQELSTLQMRITDPVFYAQDRQAISDHTAQLRDLESVLETKYAKWEEIEAGPGNH